MSMFIRLTAAQAVDVALDRARTYDGVVDFVAKGIRDSSASLRWANNTLTTNGLGWSTTLTVTAFVAVDGGVAVATLSESDTKFDVPFVYHLVERVVDMARAAEPTTHGLTLPGEVSWGDWDATHVETDVAVLANVTPQLGEVLAAGAAAGLNHSGYAEHERGTVWIGSLSGLRLRDDAEDGRLEMTCRADGGIRSAWEGKHSRSFKDLDVLAMGAALARQLSWQQNRRELAPGRYHTILPPGPVGDLLAFFDENLGGRDAYEGAGPFSRAEHETRIGERITNGRPFTLFSDPNHPGVDAMPYLSDAYESSTTSQFDMGLRFGRVDWVRDGVLNALTTTRAVAASTGLPFVPNGTNLIMEVEGGHGSLEDVIARTESGLLVNCLWYIRDLDEATMTVTGTTRDGVYEVRDGEVIGAVNNFRFNESPLSVLGRIHDAGSPVLCQTRETAESVSDFVMPSLVVDDFNMSSVSEAN